MAKDTYYFSHDFNSRHDPKMITLQMEYQMEGIGIFWCLVEMLHEQGGYIRTEYERIAYELRTDSNKVKWIIEQSGLFKIKDDQFYSESALQRILQRDEKSKKAAKSVSYRWANNERNTNVSETYNDGNTIKERKGKEIKVKERKVFIKPTLQEIESYCFERGNNVDANKFFNYYESNGWKVGRNSMKDWKATVRTWESNNFNQPQQNGKTTEFGSRIEENMHIYANLQRRLEEERMMENE